MRFHLTPPPPEQNVPRHRNLQPFSNVVCCFVVKILFYPYFQELADWESPTKLAKNVFRYQFQLVLQVWGSLWIFLQVFCQLFNQFGFYRFKWHTRANGFTEIFKWVIDFYWSYYFISDFQVRFKLHSSFTAIFNTKLDKVFKNGPSKICGRQLLKNLKGYDLPKAGHISSNFLKSVFSKLYLVYSWILFPKC